MTATSLYRTVSGMARRIVTERGRVQLIWDSWGLRIALQSLLSCRSDSNCWLLTLTVLLELSTRVPGAHLYNVYKEP